MGHPELSSSTRRVQVDFRFGAAILAVGLLAGIVLIANGCRHKDSVYPSYAPNVINLPVEPGSNNAFDTYAMEAAAVEGRAKPYLNSVYFVPSSKKKILILCQGAIADIATASRKPCSFKFVPRFPFAGAPYQSAWRLIGRSLRWRIEAASDAGLDQAIRDADTATRFGFDLTGGGATDAGLGLAIADDARRAIIPKLDAMSSEQLGRLADGIEQALNRKPPISKAIEHDGQIMKMGVQLLQDSFQRNDFHVWSENLGVPANDAISYLQGLEGNDEKRMAYFNAFDREGMAQQSYMLKNCEMALAGRDAPIKFDKHAERPWKFFSHHLFFDTMPLMTMNDQTVARTRLLVLTIRLKQMEKSGRPYPKTLAEFPAGLCLDPFSGKPFAFRSNPTEYKIYSVGENLEDNGGDTDPTFTAPDLRLEVKD